MIRRVAVCALYAVAFFIALCASVTAMLLNFNVGILLAWGLSALLVLCGFLLCKRRLRGLNITIAVLLSLLTVFCIFIGISGAVANVSYSEDAVIVLGAGIKGEEVGNTLRLRLDCAVSYYRKNPDTTIIVSGGQGPEEDITEAQAMAQYLIKNGVPQSSIIKEEQSASTHENFEYSKKLLDDKFGNNCEVAIITSRFHIYRATLIAREVGYVNITHLGAAVPWYAIPSSYLRECAAILSEWMSLILNG